MDDGASSGQAKQEARSATRDGYGRGDMVAAGRRHVVFDVVGTLVSFSHFFATIERILGPRLARHGLTAQAFGHAWMTHAELDFTFLSVSGAAVPYRRVLVAVFHRTLCLCGVADARALATEAEAERCYDEGYARLELRPGAAECIATLRAAGLDVLCLTTADLERVTAYFSRAGVAMDAASIISTDASGPAKPALDAYRPVLARLQARGDARPWFAAAHMWDVSAARRAGFRGAYCSVYEKEPCLAIFGGEMDVVADTLPEMAVKIVAALAT